MGATKSSLREKDVSDLFDRVKQRHYDLSKEILALKPARYMDKKDIQALIKRLRHVQEKMEQDMLMMVEHCHG